MKRMGIEGIYLGGWATSAKGSTTEDPGPDLASYPLSQVPDEAAGLVRALLTADRNQQYLRLQMTDEQRAATPAVDYRPFIIADADTGHGGDPHVRNLIRRFVEAGVPGYHIEDQRPGTKKCGHQGGKVLVPSDEQIKRLNTARFQLDIMGVPGIIVARTDAEAANLHRQPRRRARPAVPARRHQPQGPAVQGLLPGAWCAASTSRASTELNGHLLYALPEGEYAVADAWLERQGIAAADRRGRRRPGRTATSTRWTRSSTRSSRSSSRPGRTTPGWRPTARRSPSCSQFRERRGRAARDERRGVARVRHDARRCTPPGRRPGSWASTPPGTASGRRPPRATTRSAAASRTRSPSRLPQRRSPTCCGWRPRPPTWPTPREFAEAIHAVYPDKMLAYNLSPSFNWDTTGMSDDEMRAFPEEIGKMGFVFNFMTYGGHQIDGVAAEEFATALRAGRHAGAGPAAAQDAAGRVALPHTADAGRRPAQRRRAGGLVGPHRDHQVDGQGLDPAPAPGADRGAQEAARGLAGAVERALRARREAAGAAAAAPRRRRSARARHLRRRRRREAGQRARSTRSRTGTAAAS